MTCLIIIWNLYLEIKKMHDLVPVNVREHKSKVNELKTRGFDINNGFIIRIDNSDIYQGADAIIILNKLVEKKIYFPDNIFFRNIIYPIIKQLRRIVLFISRKNLDL